MKRLAWLLLLPLASGALFAQGAYTITGTVPSTGTIGVSYSASLSVSPAAHGGLVPLHVVAASRLELESDHRDQRDGDHQRHTHYRRDLSVHGPGGYRRGNLCDGQFLHHHRRAHTVAGVHEPARWSRRR